MFAMTGSKEEFSVKTMRTQRLLVINAVFFSPWNTSFLAAFDFGEVNTSSTVPVSTSCPLSMMATWLQISCTTLIS